MSITIPYSTDIHNVYPGDVITTRLSFALWIIDRYTGDRVIGAVKASIKEISISARKNPGGYFLFTDIAEGNYTTLIEGGFYFPVEQTVNTSSLDPKNPVVPIQLEPRPSYPFPGNATLIRGLIQSAEGPVTGASVKVQGKPIETKTDERGEFVLYFMNTKQEHIQLGIEKGGDAKTVPADIYEGKTVSAGVISFP